MATKGKKTNDAFVIDEDLLKAINDGGGVAFDSEELKAQLKAEKDREYPDFGKDIPVGEYTLTGYASSHAWTNPRTGNVVNIRTAYLAETDASGKPYELPFACFSKREFKFKPVNGDEFEPNSILPHYDSTADRNMAVVEISAGKKIKVNHSRGHWNNPDNKRPFNFTLTWASEA